MYAFLQFRKSHMTEREIITITIIIMRLMCVYMCILQLYVLEPVLLVTVELVNNKIKLKRHPKM